MADFTDKLSSMIHYGKNNFIEVTLTQIEGEDDTSEFIGIKKGFLSEDGRNYKGNVPVPMNKKTARKVAVSVLSLAGVEEFDYEKEQEDLDMESE